MGASVKNGGNSIKGGAAWDGEDEALLSPQEIRHCNAIGENRNGVNNTPGHAPLDSSRTWHNLCGRNCSIT